MRWVRRIVRKTKRWWTNRKHPIHTPTFRPFRGDTPQGVYQTIDIGSGRGEFLSRQSIERRKQKDGRKIRSRKYVAVDPMMGYLGKNTANLRFRREKIVPVIEEMIKHGEKTRHINWDMPSHTLSDYEPDRLFELIPHILLPGGKVFFSSEEPLIANRVAEIARRHGFIVRKGKPLVPFVYKRGKSEGLEENPDRFTGTMHVLGGVFESPVPKGLVRMPILRMTFQYPVKGLKKPESS